MLLIFLTALCVTNVVAHNNSWNSTDIPDHLLLDFVKVNASYCTCYWECEQNLINLTNACYECIAMLDSGNLNNFTGICANKEMYNEDDENDENDENKGRDFTFPLALIIAGFAVCFCVYLIIPWNLIFQHFITNKDKYKEVFNRITKNQKKVIPFLE